MRRNYNRLALQGLDIDDMEFVQDYKLPTEVAYTPKINEHMLNLMYEQNIKNYTERLQMPLQKAKTEAGRLRAEAKRQIDLLLSEGN